MNLNALCAADHVTQPVIFFNILNCHAQYLYFLASYNIVVHGIIEIKSYHSTILCIQVWLRHFQYFCARKRPTFSLPCSGIFIYTWKAIFFQIYNLLAIENCQCIQPQWTGLVIIILEPLEESNMTKSSNLVLKWLRVT